MSADPDPPPGAIERLLERDTLIVSLALALITILGWWYIVRLAAGMNMGPMDMHGFRMLSTGARMVMAPAAEPWSAREFAFTFAMWAVMMVGMMTPSAAPLILLYARVGRHAARDGSTVAPAAWFAGGYLLAWVLFSLAATTAQWALQRTALLAADMTTASRAGGAAVLLVAGLYQWSAFKDSCLAHCQSPLAFLQKHGGFRREPLAATALGLHHGAYCVGCCWSLMALLFVGGVMNLIWIAGLSILVLAEKIVPAGRVLSRTAGVAFCIMAVWRLI